MEELNKGRLSTGHKEFALAGNATLTLVSEKTGARYTYKIRAKKEGGTPHFVSVMYGPDNEADFRFFGTIFEDGTFSLSRKWGLPEDDVRIRAWRYFWQHAVNGQVAPNLEVWHEGRCGQCGRKLTVPESIERGFGPECWEGHRHAA
jgi:hypothetical protein